MVSRFVLVEEHRGPARYEAGFSGEPQKNQQDEDKQHAALSKAHLAQLLVLVLDDLVRLTVAFLLLAASKGLFQAWMIFKKLEFYIIFLIEFHRYKRSEQL